MIRINGVGDKNEQDIKKKVEEEKREKSAHPVLAEGSVGSCRTARFTEKHLKVRGVRQVYECSITGLFDPRYFMNGLQDTDLTVRLQRPMCTSASATW